MGEERLRVPIIIVDRVVMPGIKLSVSVRRFTEQQLSRKLIGVVASKSASNRDHYKIGTLCQVLSSRQQLQVTVRGLSNHRSPLKFQDNSRDLVLCGAERFKILNVSQEDGVDWANIEMIKDKDAATFPIREQDVIARQLKTKISSYLELTASRYRPAFVQIRLNNLNNKKDLTGVGFITAAYLDIVNAEKQKLLENLSLQERSKAIMDILETKFQEEKNVADVEQRLFGDQTVEDTDPSIPKLITQDERRQRSREGTTEDLYQRLEELKLPEDSKTYVTKELDRLRNLPPNNPEHNVIRTYVETVLDLPWNSSTEDNYDIERAQAQLDADHYALKEAKKRIIEFIAVKGLRKDTKGSIICLHGPPGVGKTSLGKSIAESLGRKFHRISLGGVRDEAEIRGHRRTYIGALPGVLLHALKKCQSKNPVILLDEIDKVGSDAVRGDPQAALLEVLDPVQNATFTDHYLSIPFDLSNVMFITTANRVDTISAPLLDRMDVINVSGYSINEKIEIAKRNLVPRQIEENGLKVEQLSFQEDALESLSTHYTAESGVRQLERKIGAVCRHTAVQLSKHLKSKNEETFARVNITPDDLENILGPRKFDQDLAERVDTPGIAIGLAWTSVGGQVLLVEASKSHGTGRLKITGQLGEVMRESVVTALSWIKASLSALVPPPTTHIAEGIDGLDIHIHFPAAAVPKDGPSAGVTITTALVSLLTETPVHPDVAMTGEVSLKGAVLPIGGVKEKVLAAHRQGMKAVILPFKNKKDLLGVPEEVQAEMKFYFTSRVEENLQIAIPNFDFTKSIQDSAYSKL